MVQDREKLKEVGLAPDKPKGHIRGIWAITIIVAFAIIVAGGVFFLLWYAPWDTGTNVIIPQDETAGWNTYENKTYDFSVKYPKDWMVKENKFSSSDNLRHFFDVDFYNPNNKEDELVGINISEGDRIAAELQSTTGTQPQCSDLKDVKIGGQDGKSMRCSDIGDLNLYWYKYLVFNGGYTFSLETKEANKATLDKMVGTLKFGAATASPSPTVTSVKYKTFKNTLGVGFSFEYPENLLVFNTIGGEGGSFGGTVHLLKNVSGTLENSNVEVVMNSFVSDSKDIAAVYQIIHESPFEAGTTSSQIAGVPALKGGLGDTYYFIKDDAFFEVAALSGMGQSQSGLNNPETKAIFDHVVSSFKFL